MKRVRSLVCERIALHAVDTEDADAPCFDIRARVRIMPWPSCSFSSPHAGGEGENGRSVIAVDGDTHVPIEPVRYQY